MSRMKKILSFIIIFALLFSSLGTTGFAATGTESEAILIRDTDRLGRGKYIYYPAELKTSNNAYPVVVWANGTGCVTLLYTKLLKSIAQAGYIVVADTTVMSADGKKQIDSIDYILAENKNADSVFYGKVDANNICAAGHSQGGRSAINAAAVDKRITCILSIAGSSNTAEATPVTCPVFFITGTADLVVLSSMWVKPSYRAVQGSAVYASLKTGVHTTCIFNPKRISGYCISWLNANLKNSKTDALKFAPDGALSKDTNWKGFACK